jgi:hypothetical protein
MRRRSDLDASPAEGRGRHERREVLVGPLGKPCVARGECEPEADPLRLRQQGSASEQRAEQELELCFLRYLAPDKLVPQPVASVHRSN